METVWTAKANNANNANDANDANNADSANDANSVIVSGSISVDPKSAHLMEPQSVKAWVVYYKQTGRSSSRADLISIETSLKAANNAVAVAREYEHKNGFNEDEIAILEVEIGVNYLISGKDGPLTMSGLVVLLVALAIFLACSRLIVATSARKCPIMVSFGPKNPVALWSRAMSFSYTGGARRLCARSRAVRQTRIVSCVGGRAVETVYHILHVTSSVASVSGSGSIAYLSGAATLKSGEQQPAPTRAGERSVDSCERDGSGSCARWAPN